MNNTIKQIIFNMEMKNYFVIAYLKFKNSIDYKKYLDMKQRQLNGDTSVDEESIKYMEELGIASHIKYLEENCEDVKKYLYLRSLVANTKTNDATLSPISLNNDENQIERRKNRVI